MLLRNHLGRHRGISIVESAICMSLTALLILGLVVGSRGIFLYNHVSALARSGTRYASVHAGMYASENATAIKAGTLPTVTQSYINTNVIQPAATGFNVSNLTVTVNINTGSGTYGWDDTTNNNNRALTSTVTQSGSAVTVSNTVSVTVSYQWFPELYLVGPFTLKSTSVLPLSY